jgi:trehalose 6-phosphate phosphatase
MKIRYDGRDGISAAQIGEFFQQLIETPKRLLLLDYDGTLAPFDSDPSRSTPYDGVREALDDIMNDGRSHVAIITGRPARELPALLNLSQTPEIWGSYGWERLSTDGDYRCGPVDISALRHIKQDSAWIRDIEGAGGWVESKPFSVAIHWRGLPLANIEEISRLAKHHWNAFAPKRLVWDEFDGGIEWKIPGRDKGYVVRSLLKEHSNAVVAYLGDDMSDEDAFSALYGRGLSVLVRAERRPTFADWWLRPPSQLIDFLLTWREFSRRGSA